MGNAELRRAACPAPVEPHAARGMAQIAEETGIGREALYKALRADAQPRFDTISRVCKALGVKLVVQPTGA